MANWRIEYIINRNTYSIFDLQSGAVPSVLSATLTNSLNSGGNLVLTITNDHPHKSAINPAKGEFRVLEDSKCVFRGRPSGATTDFDGNVTYNVEGLVSTLLAVDIGRWMLREEKLTCNYSETLLGQRFDGADIFWMLAETNGIYSLLPYTLERVTGSQMDCPDLQGSGTLGGMIQSITDNVGGWYEFDYNAMLASNKITVKYHATMADIASQQIILGDNLLTLEYERGNEDIINAVFVINDSDENALEDETWTGMYDYSATYWDYEVRNGVFLDPNSIAQYGVRATTIYTHNATREQMERNAHQIVTASKEYERCSVSAVDKSVLEVTKEAMRTPTVKFNYVPGPIITRDTTWQAYAFRTEPGVGYEIYQADGVEGYVSAVQTVGSPTPSNPGITANVGYRGHTTYIYPTEEIYWVLYGYSKEDVKAEPVFTKVIRPIEFELGKSIQVTSAPHGVNKAFPLIQLERNIIYPEEVKLTLGQREISLSNNVIYT